MSHDLKHFSRSALEAIYDWSVDCSGFEFDPKKIKEMFSEITYDDVLLEYKLELEDYFERTDISYEDVCEFLDSSCAVINRNDLTKTFLYLNF